MRKLLPFALAGLAALSFSVFAADSSVKGNTTGDKADPASSANSSQPATHDANTGAKRDTSAGASAGASTATDKPVKKKARKAKKVHKEDKASSGSSAVKRDRPAASAGTSASGNMGTQADKNAPTPSGSNKQPGSTTAQ